MSLRGDAIFNTHASVVTVRDGKGYDSSDNEVTLDDAAVTTELNRLQTDFDGKAYQRTRAAAYPPATDFMEAYTEKEIDGNSAKWDAYVIARNKVRTDNPK
jgi:hypothetical protein